MKYQIIVATLFLLITTTFSFAQNKPVDSDQQYKLLATTKTSTMQKELNRASADGFRIIVGSRTRGSEMAVFLSRDEKDGGNYKYKLLATSRTSTMQKELNQMASSGYRLIPSTMLAKKELFGGTEIVLIMELPPHSTKRYQYRFLATRRTRTLQKEVTEAKAAGFVLVGMVSRGEHMVVMEREVN